MWVIEDDIRQKTEEKCRESVESKTRVFRGRGKERGVGGREGGRGEGGGEK